MDRQELFNKVEAVGFALYDTALFLDSHPTNRMALDFFRDVPELKVPVILTEGRHDQNTPASIAHRWYDGLRAPKKQWIWFENSAHSPIHEEPERWCKEVRAALFGA